MKKTPAQDRHAIKSSHSEAVETTIGPTQIPSNSHIPSNKFYKASLSNDFRHFNGLNTFEAPPLITVSLSNFF